MNYDILSPEKDPMGAAILDFQKTGKAGKLRVLSSMFEEDEMPVKHLFRSYHDMPKLEKKALDLARGKVLDVGAGAGCHSLALQKRMEQEILKGSTFQNAITSIKTIDISPLSCEAMKLRGVKDVECINLFNPQLGNANTKTSHYTESTEDNDGFDTILLLMNGTGIAGKIANLPALFQHLKSLLNPNGQILIDSSDLKYIYENEDGSFDIDLNGPYYGEVDYQMVYGKTQGEPFDWLYVDFPLLKSIAESCGLQGELIADGEHYDYLARLS